MKSTGIVREVDPLGRVVIPKETRDLLDMGAKRQVEVFVSEDMVVLKKYMPGCYVCGSFQGLTKYESLQLCPKCLEAINAASKK